MLGFDLPEVEAQWFEQDIRKHGDAVAFALAITNNDLAVGKVQVFDTQPQNFS